MARRPGPNHSPAFKAKVQVAAIKGERALIGLAQDFDVHPNPITARFDKLGIDPALTINFRAA